MSPDVQYCNIPATDTIAAHRLAYYDWGDKTADKTVLCVHGLTRNARDFDFLAKALDSNYRVISVDIAGRGKSHYLSDPASYNYTTYATDMATFIHILGLKDIHWVGTSMGGIIGMMLINMLPGVIRSLTLNDIGCLIPASGLKRILAYAGNNTIFETRSLAEQALRSNCQSFGITNEEHWQHLFVHSIIEENGKIRLAYDPHITDSLPPADKAEDVEMWPMWEAVSKIPTLLIRGENSDILLRETALNMQTTHPQLTLAEIANTGHAPMLMDDAQIKLIREWLETV